MDEFVRIMNASNKHTHKQRIFQNVAVENPGIATSPKNKWANKATEKKGKEEGEEKKVSTLKFMQKIFHLLTNL